MAHYSSSEGCLIIIPPPLGAFNVNDHLTNDVPKKLEVKCDMQHLCRICKAKFENKRRSVHENVRCSVHAIPCVSLACSNTNTITFPVFIEERRPCLTLP